jgi:hypothetical protein
MKRLAGHMAYHYNRAAAGRIGGRPLAALLATGRNPSFQQTTITPEGGIESLRRSYYLSVVIRHHDGDVRFGSVGQYLLLSAAFLEKPAHCHCTSQDALDVT